MGEGVEHVTTVGTEETVIVKTSLLEYNRCTKQVQVLRARLYYSSDYTSKFKNYSWKSQINPSSMDYTENKSIILKSEIFQFYNTEKS